MIKEHLGCIILVLLPLFSIFLNIFFVVFYIVFGWVYIPYLLWFILFDRLTPENGGRNTNRRECVILKWFQSYLYGSIYYEQELDYKNKTYLFGVHPHGLITMASWANLAPHTNIRIATLASNFYIPIFREILLYFGFISASKYSIIRCLKQKKSVAIIVGGAEEALYINKGIVLNKRKGFIEIALKTGASLVPVYHFGEQKLYTIYDQNNNWIHWMQIKCKKLVGFTIPIFWGRCCIFPKRKQVFTVIGNPIDVPQKVPEPTKRQIDELHTRYKEALLKLHEEYRESYGEKRLVIIK